MTVSDKRIRTLKRFFSVVLLSAGMAILGCGPTQTIIITATTLPPTSTVEATAVPIETSTASTGLEPTSTQVVIPTAEQEALDPIPPDWLTVQPIISELVSVSHPPTYEVLLNERFSVDGVRVEAPRTLSLRNPTAENGFVMTIENI